ncbi:MAG: hypothetical protein WD010_03340 [Nitriliruptor sp.]|uniref:hypothetical protein n=1 Tax=Nitriliruptor sp. TaxID=2448056 RepID=UPI0034A0614A
MTTWDTATERLLALATAALDDGLPPAPTLAAYAGDEGLAIVGLRPFAPHELTGPLVELAALLLPLGADRFVLALPGRAWSIDDPVPPVVEDVDLRHTVLTVLEIDGHGPGEPRCDGTIHPYGRGADGVARFEDPVPVGWPEGPSADALRLLVARRAVTFDPDPDPAQVVVQFARCLLRGHQVVLAPAVADHLEALTAATP